MSLVGKDIDCLCSRCKLTLAHVVLYEVGGHVEGVQCKTCGAKHRYRGPKLQRRKEVPAERRPRPGVSQVSRPPVVRPADSRLWELKLASAAPDAVIWPFRLTDGYEKGDWIEHPRFGRGLVEKVTTDRMEVLFREGRKLLAMNRQEPEPGV